MDSSHDQADQVAHILHGTRQAEEGEQGCDECGSVLCNLCCVTNSAFDCYLCDPCHLRCEQEQHERQYAQDEAYEQWRQERKDQRTEQIRWAAIGVIVLWQLYTQ